MLTQPHHIHHIMSFNTHLLHLRTSTINFEAMDSTNLKATQNSPTCSKISTRKSMLLLLIITSNSVTQIKFNLIPIYLKIIHLICHLKICSKIMNKTNSLRNTFLTTHYNFYHAKTTFIPKHIQNNWPRAITHLISSPSSK